MSQDTIPLEADKTLVVIIDPQTGFADKNGSFSRAFGEKEIEEIRKALETSSSFISTLPETTPVACVKSTYSPGQFTNGDLSKPLSYLCVPGANNDSRISRHFYLPDYAVLLTKNTNNAAEHSSYMEFILGSIRKGIENIVFGGCTTTSCINESVAGTHDFTAPYSVRIFVPQDMVGARSCKYLPAGEGKSDVEKTLEKFRKQGINVLKSGSNIVWI